MPEPSVTELNARNKSAWNELYASTPDLIWGREPIEFLPSVLPSPADLPPGPVLDAGTGEGRNLPLLRGLGREITACDSSAAALRKIPAELGAGVSTRVCDLGQTGLPERSFAFILLCDTVETLPAPEPVLREMFRLLRPGGQLLANLPALDDGIAGVDMQPAPGGGWLYLGSYYYRFFSRPETDGLFAGAGFETLAATDCRWTEPPHPHFRGSSHRHHSRVMRVRRPL